MLLAFTAGIPWQHVMGAAGLDYDHWAPSTSYFVGLHSYERRKKLSNNAKCYATVKNFHDLVAFFRQKKGIIVLQAPYACASIIVTFLKSSTEAVR